MRRSHGIDLMTMNQTNDSNKIGISYIFKGQIHQPSAAKNVDSGLDRRWSFSVSLSIRCRMMTNVINLLTFYQPPQFTANFIEYCHEFQSCLMHPRTFRSDPSPIFPNGSRAEMGEFVVSKWWVICVRKEFDPGSIRVNWFPLFFFHFWVED